MESPLLQQIYSRRQYIREKTFQGDVKRIRITQLVPKGMLVDIPMCPEGVYQNPGENPRALYSNTQVELLIHPEDWDNLKLDPDARQAMDGFYSGDIRAIFGIPVIREVR